MNGYGYTRPQAPNPFGLAGGATYDPRMIEAYKQPVAGLPELEQERRRATLAKATGDPNSYGMQEQWLKDQQAENQRKAEEEARNQGAVKAAGEQGYADGMGGGGGGAAPVSHAGPMPTRFVPPMPQFGGMRETGGPMDPGKAYLVGEKGPEIVVPREPGMVIPNGGAPEMPPHPNDMPTPNAYRDGGQYPVPTRAAPVAPGMGMDSPYSPDRRAPGDFGPMPTAPTQTTTGMDALPPAARSPSSRTMPTIFDIGTQAGEQRDGPMSSAPTTWRAPAQFEDGYMRGMTGSQKKHERQVLQKEIAKASMDDQLSLDKQAKGAQGAWEAAKATRKELGLAPIDPELDKQFWNGNVQKQLAMTQQLHLLNQEHLNERRDTTNQQRHDAEKKDDRLWHTQLTQEERAYQEKRHATLTKEQRDAAMNYQPLIVGGQETGYAHNEQGQLIHLPTGKPAELTSAQIAAIRKDGGRVSIGPQGTKVSYGGDKPTPPGKAYWWDAKGGKTVELPEDVTPHPSSGLLPMKRKGTGANSGAAGSKYFQ